MEAAATSVEQAELNDEARDAQEPGSGSEAGSVGEGEGGAGNGGGGERTNPERVPSPQHRDFRDQHDEPRRFCAGVAFQRLLRARLPQSNGSPAPHGAICQPRAAEEKNELCS